MGEVPVRHPLFTLVATSLPVDSYRSCRATEVTPERLASSRFLFTCQRPAGCFGVCLGSLQGRRLCRRCFCPSRTLSKFFSLSRFGFDSPRASPFGVTLEQDGVYDRLGSSCQQFLSKKFFGVSRPVLACASTGGATYGWPVVPSRTKIEPS